MDLDPAERVYLVRSFFEATNGVHANVILLPRSPKDDNERRWVEDVLRTRLEPGGRIEVERHG